MIDQQVKVAESWHGCPGLGVYHRSASGGWSSPCTLPWRSLEQLPVYEFNSEIVAVKITLTGENSVRLEPTDGPMTIEAPTPDRQYSPFHMLGSSLAYCTFSVMYSWATLTRQSVDDLRIDVRWTFSEDEPKRVSNIRLTYQWPSLPEKKREGARRAAELCTIHATLTHSPAIDIASA